MCGVQLVAAAASFVMSLQSRSLQQAVSRFKLFCSEVIRVIPLSLCLTDKGFIWIQALTPSGMEHCTMGFSKKILCHLPSCPAGGYMASLETLQNVFQKVHHFYYRFKRLMDKNVTLHVNIEEQRLSLKYIIRLNLLVDIIVGPPHITSLNSNSADNRVSP
jgi:hypothetical protein